MTAIGPGAASGTPPWLEAAVGALRPVWIWMALFGVLNLHLLANFVLSIDDEIGALRQDPLIWISQGRWVIYFFERYLMPQPVLPTVPVLVFALFMALAYARVLAALGVDRPGALHHLGFIPFGCFPIWGFILEFEQNTPVQGLGVLFIAFGLAPALRAAGALGTPAGASGRSRDAALAVLWLTLGIGCYQANAPLAAVLVTGAVLLLLARGRLEPGRVPGVIAALAGVVIVATGLSLAIWGALLWAFQAPVDQLPGYWRPHRLFEAPGYVLPRTVQQIGMVYGGGPTLWGLAAWSFPVVAGLGALAVLIGAGRSRAGIAWSLVLLAAMLAIPFVFNLLNGDWLPARILIGAAPAMAVLALAGLLAPHRALSMAMAVAVVGLAFHTAVINHQFQAAAHFARVHDQMLAGRLVDRLAEAVPDFDPGRTYPLDVYGAVPHRSAFGALEFGMSNRSFFEWDGGNPNRIVRYLALLGVDRFQAIEPAERARLLPVMEALPVWPAPGSIALHDGVILIRLGSRPGLLHMDAGATPGGP